MQTATQEAEEAKTTHTFKQHQKKKKRKQYANMKALSKEEEEPQTIHTDVSNINKRKKDANTSQPCLQHHKHNKTRIFHTSIQITSKE